MDAEPSPRPFVRILRLPVHAITRAEALQACVEIAEGTAPPGYVVTAGALLATQAQKSDPLVGLAEQAALVVADGAGLVWAARRRGFRTVERIPGIELCDELLSIAGKRGWRVFLVGARPAAILRAIVNLEDAHPGLRISGFHDGYFLPNSPEEALIVKAIGLVKPHLLLVGLGQPRQEEWCRAVIPGTGVRLAIGIGGSFDVWAGDVVRAPRWMGRAGLEWAWRLFRQPWRAGRMRNLPGFVRNVLREERTARS